MQLSRIHREEKEHASNIGEARVLVNYIKGSDDSGIEYNIESIFANDKDIYPKLNKTKNAVLKYELERIFQELKL